MVKLINNVPCEYVEQFDTDVEFILLHKILDNKKYREYYQAQRDNGKYKILDNGAYELGSSLDPIMLIAYANTLDVDEVIAPDVFKDKDKTLVKLNEFVRLCPVEFRIQAVPQGRNTGELVECLNEMLNNPRVSVIGFNKLWDRHSLLFAENVKRAYGMGKEVHLLGVNNLHDWVSVYENKFIRSADSRVISKIVSGVDDTWEVKLDKNQLNILKRLHTEVMLWQK